MHDIAGLVALAVIGLWIAYLVPHRLRYRQQLLESRTEDRFSDALRVLAVTDARRRDVRAAEARAECGPDSPKRSGLLSPARGVPVGGRPVMTEGKGGVVERPYGTQDRITADDARRAARLRAQRAASLARRAAAARRRAALTAVLLVASVVAWVVVGVTAVAVVAAVVPTVLLGGALLLGRRAVVVGKAADEAWEQRQSPLATAPAAPRARVTGRAHRPSDSHTEAIAQVDGGAARTGAAATGSASDDAAQGAPATSAHPADGDETQAATSGSADDDADHEAGRARPEASGAPRTSGADADAVAGSPAESSSEGWSPVPVPRPTYTTKATAPRREPLPLVVEDATAAGGAQGTTGTADPSTEEAALGASTQDVGSTAPAVDLDAILARRRAAGE